jgi:hypothetical protein
MVTIPEEGRLLCKHRRNTLISCLYTTFTLRMRQKIRSIWSYEFDELQTSKAPLADCKIAKTDKGRPESRCQSTISDYQSPRR